MPRKRSSSPKPQRNARIRGEFRAEPDLEMIAMTVLDRARFLAGSNQTPEQAHLASLIHDDTIATIRAMGIESLPGQSLPHCTCQTCWSPTRSQK